MRWQRDPPRCGRRRWTGMPRQGRSDRRPALRSQRSCRRRSRPRPANGADFGDFGERSNDRLTRADVSRITIAACRRRSARSRRSARHRRRRDESVARQRSGRRTLRPRAGDRRRPAETLIARPPNSIRHRDTTALQARKRPAPYPRPGRSCRAGSPCRPTAILADAVAVSVSRRLRASPADHHSRRPFHRGRTDRHRDHVGRHGQLSNGMYTAPFVGTFGTAPSGRTRCRAGSVSASGEPVQPASHSAATTSSAHTRGARPFYRCSIVVRQN